jgi:tetratricopeptide (TPR) repeat protein
VILAIICILSQVQDDPAGLTRRGHDLLREGRRGGVHELLEEAEGLYLQALALAPASAPAWNGLAYARLGRHDFDGALAAARAALRIEPDDSALLALLGDVHFGAGNLTEAEAAWRMLHARGETLASLARLGLAAEARGRDAEAERNFRDALEAGRLLEVSVEDIAWCHCMLAELEQNRGHAAAAEHSFRAATVLDPQSRFAAQGLARALTEQSRADEALTILMELVERLPEPAHFVQIGETLETLGRAEEARGWYARCEADVQRDFARGDFGHARELAELWLDHGGDPERALELALRDLNEVRHDSGAWETAAWAFFRCGRFAEAAQHVTEALRSGGGEARLWRRAAEVYAAAGDRLRAARCRKLAEERASRPAEAAPAE